MLYSTCVRRLTDIIYNAQTVFRFAKFQGRFDYKTFVDKHICRQTNKQDLSIARCFRDRGVHEHVL